MAVGRVFAEAFAEEAERVFKLASQWATELAMSPFEIVAFTDGYGQLERHLNVTVEQIRGYNVTQLLVLIQCGLHSMIGVKERNNVELMEAVIDKLLGADYDSQVLGKVS